MAFPYSPSPFPSRAVTALLNGRAGEKRVRVMRTRFPVPIYLCLIQYNTNQLMRGAGPITAMSTSGEDLSINNSVSWTFEILLGVGGWYVVVTLFCDRVI